MRNPFRSLPLLVCAVLMTGVLLVGDVMLAPAAHAVSRRAPAGGYPYALAMARRKAAAKIYRQRLIETSRSRSVAPRVAPAPAATAAAAAAGDVWAKLRQCESGGRYDIDTGNGFYGAYQFMLSTWRGLGYSGYPHEAPPAVQDEAAQKLQARSGWGQWPACSRRLGLR